MNLQNRFNELLLSYQEEEQVKISKALSFASILHKEQKRKNGDPYIVHPLAVAITLMTLHVDCATVCAGLLHDVVEDTAISLPYLEKLFGGEVSLMVDGVTKLGDDEYPDKKERKAATIQKLLKMFMKDPRVIMIKLADRLHNMHTLKYMSLKKQIEISKETLEIYVPLAYEIGAYDIKKELEDLCLMYLQPKKYAQLKEACQEYKKEHTQDVIDQLAEIKDVLANEGIETDVRTSVKNIYGIYKKLDHSKSIKDSIKQIPDMFSLKIIVKDIETCQKTLEILTKKYSLDPSLVRDYINYPKTNLYQALHVIMNCQIGEEDFPIVLKIYDQKMAKIADLGIIAYCEIYGPKATIKMKEEMLKGLKQFILQIEEMLEEQPTECIESFKENFSCPLIYVHKRNGALMEIPLGATIVDAAYYVHTEIGNAMAKGYVNGREVPFDYVLQADDTFEIKKQENQSGLCSLPPDYHYAKTKRARRKILECWNKVYYHYPTNEVSKEQNNDIMLLERKKF